MRIGNSAPHAASQAARGIAQAHEALKQKADPGPKASAQVAPGAVAHISDKGKAAAAKAAAENNVEKATREAAAQNSASSAQNATKAAGMLRAQLAQMSA